MAITPATPIDTSVDRMAAIRDAFVKGTDVDEAVSGLNADEPSLIGEASEDSLNRPVVEATPVSQEEQAPEQVSTSTQESNPDTEVLYVKGPNGEKHKLEISYSDRQKIKDAFAKAAGMRKFATERDQYKKQHEEAKKKLEELSSNFSKLETIFKERGAKGIFEQLGGEGAFEKAVEAELQRREYLANLSPEEKFQLSAKEREAEYQKSHEELKRKYDDMLGKLTKEQEQATIRSLESKLTPAFEKVRFKGQLGDGVAEQEIDEAIWSKVTNRLSEYPDDVELTQAIIEKEFRNVAGIYKKLLDKQVDVKLKQSVEKKKEEATTKAQGLVKKNMTAQSLNADVADDIKNSNWSSLLQKVMLGKANI